MNRLLDKDQGAARVEPARIALALALVAAPLLLGQQVPATLEQDFGSNAPLLNVNGLGLPEQGERGPFRWSSDRITIWLQPLGYPSYVSLRVQGVRPNGESLARLELSSEGRDLGVYDLPRSPSTVEVRLPAATVFSINPRLDITSTTFQIPGDRRQLGTVFYGLEQRAGGFWGSSPGEFNPNSGPSVPSLWPALALLLSGVLVYWWGRAVIRRIGVAFALVGVWGVALGALNAAARPWLVFYSWYFVVPPLVALLLTPWARELIGARVGVARRVSELTPDTPHPTPHTPHPADESVAITARPWRVALPVTVAALGVLAWHLVAPLVPSGASRFCSCPTDNLAWGAAFYGALPWQAQVAGVVLALAAIGWAWGFWILDFGFWIGLKSKIQNTQWLPWALVGLGALAFAVLRVQHSEGDSTEFDAKIPKGAIWRERELLDFYLKARLWQLVKPWLPLPSQVYALSATLAGWIYMVGALLMGRAMGMRRSRGPTREVVAVMLALASIGNIVLFFGYIESYALVTVASLFVLWACWRYTQGQLSFRAVGLTATLAPLFHGSALWWGPMVVAAWLLRAWRRPRDKRWREALAEMGNGVVVGVAILLVLASVMLIDGYDLDRLRTGLEEMGGADARTLMPLFTTVTAYEHYPFFSWIHLGAVVQEQLLTAPLALLTIIIVVVAAWRGVGRLQREVPAMATLAVGSASMLFYSISWNPDLGPRKDWDLLSLPALPLTLLAVYFLVRLPAGRARRVALSSYLAVSAVHTAAWVLVHLMGMGY